MKRREVDIQLSILRYLKNIGAVAGKTKTMGVRRGKSFCYDPYLFVGFPDITCFYRSQLFFIEVKSEQGKLSDAQIYFQSLCKTANIPYIVAHSLDEVLEVIQPEIAHPLS